MTDFLLLPVNQLFYHRLDVRIAAVQDTRLDAWPGAIIRNNLLYAAEQIRIEEKGSLREKINQCPLNENHPLYKELVNGFPKGYVIALPDSCQPEEKIKKGDTICFSIYLIGSLSDYYAAFIEAIQLMCKQGMGHPVVPFVLVDVCERALDGELHLLRMGATDMSQKLIFPISYADFQSIQAHKDETVIEIEYLTPTILFKPVNKKNKSISFQDKSNGFPSAYQLVRSVLYRMFKLTILYVHPNDADIAKLLMDNIEEFIDYATNLSLVSADIQKVTLKNTLKKETENKMPLSGYVGIQRYEGYFNRFLPALRFMEALGIGNEVVYGMGRYKVEFSY
jgi:hypothetical protein